MEIYNLSMVFARTVGWTQKELVVTPRMLRALAAIDGKRSIAELAEHLAVSYEALFVDLKGLHEMQLIRISAQKKDDVEVTQKKKRLHYRGNVIDLEKKAIINTKHEQHTKNEHYRGTPYAVRVD